MTDQQNAGMMSCTGNKCLKTLALDRLSSDGLRFEQAYCTNPLCVPSRTSMATGVMSCRLGAADNKSGMSIRRLPHDVDENSMGKIMSRAGYDTFYGGKVHMCESLSPLQAGYQEYYEDEREMLPAACLDFVGRNRDRPFFAVASFINPHDICFAHRARCGVNTHDVMELYKTASSLAPAELPPLPDNHALQQDEPSAIEALLNLKAITPAVTMRKEYDERAWRINRWIYHRLTEKVDGQIGMILDGLKAAGLEDDTVVIFTSDHGDMDASHKLASKHLFYDESARVPLIIRYKPGIHGDRIDRSHLVSTGLDILPTVCDYAGIKQPEHILGKSLRPLAEDRPVEGWRTYVASENHHARMIRSQQYKYCVYDDECSQESLVDMKRDSGEMRNLVDDPACRTVLAQHRKLLVDWCELSQDADSSKFLKHGRMEA